MSVFLQATLEVEGAGYARFLEAMRELVPIAESAGWKLSSAYMHRTGRLNTFVDIWELEDMNHVDRGFAVLMEHPRFPELHKVLGETVRNETLVFLQKISYV